MMKACPTRIKEKLDMHHIIPLQQSYPELNSIKFYRDLPGQGFNSSVN